MHWAEGWIRFQCGQLEGTKSPGLLGVRKEYGVIFRAMHFSHAKGRLALLHAVQTRVEFLSKFFGNKQIYQKINGGSTSDTMSRGRGLVATAGRAQFITSGNEVKSSHLWSLVAEQGLRQHLGKYSAIVRTWGGFIPPTREKKTHSLFFSSPSSSSLPLTAFLLSWGWQTLVISRYSGPGGSGFPLARGLCCMCSFMA